MKKEKEESGLTADSSINEIFTELVLPESGINVRPITLQQDKTDTRMMILIRGEHTTASFIMAEIMSKIQELFDLQEQAEASVKPQIQRV